MLVKVEDVCEDPTVIRDEVKRYNTTILCNFMCASSRSYVSRNSSSLMSM